MTFLMFEQRVLELLKEVLGENDYQLTEPPRPEFGDLSTSICFKMARIMKKRPNEIAKEVTERIKKNLLPDDIVMDVKAIGGYINFKTNFRVLAKLTLKEVLEKADNYGAVNIGNGRKVLIEHTNVNPNKAIHIGHARNACLGDSLVRLLRFAGFNVYALNYIDDTGSQIADVIVGFKYLGFPLDRKDIKFDKYCGDYVYVNVNKIYKEKPELEKLRGEVIKLIEKGDNPIAKFTRKIADKVVREQLKTCWRLGVFFDLFNWESDILKSGLWEEAFKILRDKKVVEYAKEGEYKGCWIIKLKELPEFMHETDKVLVRSDGTLTYIAKDIPYAMWKVGLIKKDFNYDIYVDNQPNGSKIWTTITNAHIVTHPDFKGGELAVSVIDVRQSRLQNIIKMILKLIGGSKTSDKYVHYSYEVVALSRSTAVQMGIPAEELGKTKIVHMSGRRGAYFNVDDVLDLMKKKAIEESKKRNPDMNADELERIGEAIAVSALRYQLVKQSRDKILIFDLDEALKLEGDTGVYLMYTYARAVNIIKKASYLPNLSEIDYSVYEGEEIELLKMISKFPVVIRNAVKNLSPQEIAIYSYNLSDLFNRFYEKRPVLKERERIRNARLALVISTAQTLKNAFNIIGVHALDRI